MSDKKMDLLDLLTVDSWWHIVEEHLEDPQDKLNLLECLHGMEDYFPDWKINELKMAAGLMIFAEENHKLDFGIGNWVYSFIKYRSMSKYIRSVIDGWVGRHPKYLYNACCQFIFPEKVEKCIKAMDSGTVIAPPIINGVVRCYCEYPAEYDEGEEEEWEEEEDEGEEEEEWEEEDEEKEDWEKEESDTDKNSEEESNEEDADTEEDEGEASEEESEEEDDDEIGTYAPIERVMTLLSKIAQEVKKLVFIAYYTPSYEERSTLIQQLLTSLPNLEVFMLVFRDSFSVDHLENNGETGENNIPKLPRLRYIEIRYEARQEFPSHMPCPDLSQTFENLTCLYVPLPLWKNDYSARRLCFPKLRCLRLEWIKLGDAVDEYKIFKIFSRLEAPNLINILLMFGNTDSSQSEHDYFMKNIVLYFLKDEHTGKKCRIIDNITAIKFIWFLVDINKNIQRKLESSWMLQEVDL